MCGGWRSCSHTVTITIPYDVHDWDWDVCWEGKTVFRATSLWLALIGPLHAPDGVGHTYLGEALIARGARDAPGGLIDLRSASDLYLYIPGSGGEEMDMAVDIHLSICSVTHHVSVSCAGVYQLQYQESED